ncbi:hypothetical protein [Spirosoma arboris]|nr:hypothetical protein [Spirosoma arboris]
MVVHLGVEGNSESIIEKGTALLRRSYDWWSIERITFGNWELA